MGKFGWRDNKLWAKDLKIENELIVEGVPQFEGADLTGTTGVIGSTDDSEGRLKVMVNGTVRYIPLYS